MYLTTCKMLTAYSCNDC